MANDLWRKYKSLYSSTSNSFSTGTGETVTPNSVSGLPTTTDTTLTFDRVDSGGTATPTKVERIIGTISGSNFVIKERGVDGTTEQAHTSPVVEMIWNAKDWNDLIDGLLVEHNQTGVHKAITTSQITASYVVASQVTASNMTTRLTHTACTVNASQVTTVAETVTNLTASAMTGTSKFPKVYGLYDAGSSGSAIAINWLNGDRQKVTVDASTTVSFTNAADGQILTLLLKNAASGVFSVTLPTMKWTASTATTLGTTSGCINTITCMYDATGSQYLAQAGASYG
jgi:hypothetical protein